MAQRYFPVVWDTIEDVLKAIHTQYGRYEEIDTGGDSDGGSETLQQVINNSPVLNKLNKIDGGNQLLVFDNVGEFNIWSGTDLDNQSGLFGELIISPVFSDMYNQDATGNKYANVQTESDTHGGAGMYYAGLESGNATNRARLRVYEDGTIVIIKGNGTPRNISALNVADDFADDTAAGVGGIAVGELYHTSGAVKIRLA